MAEPTAISGTSTAPAGGSKGRLAMLGTIAGLTVLALLAGGGTGFLLRAAPEPAPQAPAEAASAAETAAPAGAAPGTRLIVPLEPVITNVSAPTGVVVRLEASLVLDAAANADPQTLALQVGADTLAFLRTVELAQIEGARGLLHLREDLLERAKLRSGAVTEYVLKSLVVQ